MLFAIIYSFIIIFNYVGNEIIVNNNKCDYCHRNASQRPKCFFCPKKLLLHVVTMKKVAIEVSLLFGHLKMSEGLEESRKMLQKI